MRLTVSHGGGSYPVTFVPRDEAFGGLAGCAAILTDENVARHYLGSFPKGVPVRIVPAGEGSKSPKTYIDVLRWLAAHDVPRAATIAAVGGGVVGDLGGFVAASYMRGIRYVQVPTTLLAQVDSSVGGKVGIDLPEGKNLVGAFHAPVRVAIALETLATLDERQFRNGMAEVLKYGFILDPRILEQTTGKFDARSEKLQAVVSRCVELKAEVVREDELETTGLRAILNFGHTVGHAIEHCSGYGPILHGEAISIGMVVEARLGELMGVTPSGTEDVVSQSLRQHGLPTESDWTQNADALIASMRRDKKAGPDGLAFSLLTELGGCKLIRGVPEESVRAALQRK